VDTQARKQRRVLRLQRYLVNPPVKAGVMLGLIPGHAVIETIGRKSRRRRRTVVGCHLQGKDMWVVAEQGRHAGGSLVVPH
jgi:hypothetical protein